VELDHTDLCVVHARRAARHLRATLLEDQTWRGVVGGGERGGDSVGVMWQLG
jgi:hypothetical protein